MTYATNVMGTVHVLEAARHLPGVKAVVIVTSDKCYENRGSPRGYRESDALGGHDPYSSSKACAELVADSYRRSFFAPYGSALVASVRAGNVVGGGDWAEDRAVPDAMRAFIAGAPLKVRNPNAVRPWQHVLDPVLGYLMLAEGLYSGRSELAEAWNFAPRTDSDISVASLADALVRLWGTGASWEREADAKQPYEAPHLRLDCSKAVDKLGWRPSFDLHQTLALTVDWYRALEGGADMRAVTLGQIERALEGAEPRAAMASDLAAGLDG